MDDELVKEIKKRPSQNSEVLFEEHNFIASCLKMGLSLQDLKELEYKDIAKIMLCYTDEPKNRPKKATQVDWDRLAR